MLSPEEARTKLYELAQSEQHEGRFGKAAEFFEDAHAWGDAAANYGRMGLVEQEMEMWEKARKGLSEK